MEVGSAGHVTAYADGSQGVAATFDWGDGSAPDVEITNPDPDQSPVSTHTYTANGTYTVTVTSRGQTATADAVIGDLAVVFDPAGHTVAEVQQHVTAHPDAAQAVRDAEAAGKARSTLLSWLDEVLGA